MMQYSYFLLGPEEDKMVIRYLREGEVCVPPSAMISCCILER